MNGQVQAGTGSASRTWFLYAGGQLVSEFTDAASNTYTSPTSPGGAGEDDYATMLYQHSDHLTTRVTTDNTGETSNQQAHYPYGENWYNTGTAAASVLRKFTSYRKETDSSLASGQINYAVARYHGARIGRFVTPEPRNSGGTSGTNGYSYGPNDPINRPTGDAPPRVDEDGSPASPFVGIPAACLTDAVCRFAYMQCMTMNCKMFESTNWATFGPYANWVWGLGQGSGGYTHTLGGGGGFGSGFSFGFGFGFGGGFGFAPFAQTPRCANWRDGERNHRAYYAFGHLCNEGMIFIEEWACPKNCRQTLEGEGTCGPVASDYDIEGCRPKEKNSPDYDHWAICAVTYTSIDDGVRVVCHCCARRKR